MSSILITGGGRGVGLGLVQEALARGWTVAATVRSEAGRHALESLNADKLTILDADIADQSAVDKAASAFHGPLDVLVNNAGILGPDRQSTLDMDFDGFAETLAVNTLAPLMVAQAFLPLLRRSDHGRIVTISSQMGMMAYSRSDRIAYRASKAAVNKIMQGLATDLHASGVAVQVIHPGWVRSDMGGPSADISIEQSARGIMDRVDELGMAMTGTFVNYDGATMAW